MAKNKRYDFEAYVSDELVHQIHKLLYIHTNGIILDNFLNLFQVYTFSVFMYLNNCAKTLFSG